jgi:uncharacterized protein YndB with AHSA1/START domain/uncharacterized protein YciI
MAQKKHYLVKLLGTRPTWPEDVTDVEMKVMHEHFVYLQNLMLQKKVLVAGPHFDPGFGLVILQVADESEARGIMDNEPSVTQGLHTYELSELRVSIFAHHSPAVRYVDKPSDKILRKEAVVPAPVESVWTMWTTADGVKSFMATDAKIELRPGGAYEWYFSADAPEGQRGSEDCKVLGYLPMRMLSFEWNAPPEFGPLRDKRTQVVLQFEKLNDQSTKVSLTQHGWGEGEEWEKLYDYFDKAWSHVLECLTKKCGANHG